ncbi:MAG: malonyl-CoA decarboxylase family protein [Pseudomonadota bacterium]
MATLREFLSSVTEGVTPLRWRPAVPLSLLECAGRVQVAEGFDQIRQAATDFWISYDAADDNGRLELFSWFNADLGLDVDEARAALDAYEQERSAASLQAFTAKAEAPRREIFRRLNQAKGGTGCLVAMRNDLLKALRTAPDLKAVDVDLKFLLKAWFNLGVLELRPLDWNSPAQVLEKLIKYEAVHQIDSWRALRQRTEPPDRRCFGYFHPSMPDEPIIFVQVALGDQIPNSISEILAEEREIVAHSGSTVATFYSISNCQGGLAGISFGNFLIKQVVKFLQVEFEHLETFVTLSPIPGLADWAATTPLGENLEQDVESLRQMTAYYLAEVSSERGGPRDPVARFHLGNGARIHAIHADADLSEKGRAQSFGAMVNYLYDVADMTENHHAFMSEGKIAQSKAVAQLVTAGRQKITQVAAE